MPCISLIDLTFIFSAAKEHKKAQKAAKKPPPPPASKGKAQSKPKGKAPKPQQKAAPRVGGKR